MVSTQNATIAVALVAVLGGGYYYWMQREKDNTPVGLVVTQKVNVQLPDSIGETSNGTSLTVGMVEGTWREDEDSSSVASESEEKPLIVVYEGGTPIYAEVTTASDWDGENVTSFPECETAHGETEECLEVQSAHAEKWKEMWRDFAIKHGATKNSAAQRWPEGEGDTLTVEQEQEAESIFTPLLRRWKIW